MGSTADEFADARFWSKVTVGGCWLWTAAVSAKGYATYKLAGKLRRAHRVVYEAMVGPIPPGAVIDHLCRNRACVHPLHLEAVSSGENTRRGDKALYGTHHRNLTHCPAGHEYDAANTYRTPKGDRRCRACKAAR